MSRLGGTVFAGTIAALAFAAGPTANIPPRMLLLDGAVTGADVIAVGERGTIIRSADNARTWQSCPSPTRATLTGISFSPSPAPSAGWAVGHDAVIVATTDGGRGWAIQYQGENLADSFLDVLALDARRVIAVGAYGLFVATSDGGKTWTRRRINDADYHFNRITRGPSGSLYLAGEHGTLLRSGDDGTTWTPIAAPYEGSFYGIIPIDQRTLLAHGLRGRVFRSLDDGSSWHRVESTVEEMLASAVKLKSHSILLAGSARRLLLSRDSGLTIGAAPAGLATAVAELVELPDGNVLALGEAGATVLSAP